MAAMRFDSSWTQRKHDRYKQNKILNEQNSIISIPGVIIYADKPSIRRIIFYNRSAYNGVG